MSLAGNYSGPRLEYSSWDLETVDEVIEGVCPGMEGSFNCYLVG